MSTHFRSVTPFQGGIVMNAGHLITPLVSCFTVTTSKKKPYHKSTNGSTRTIMVCSHFGGFSIWVLFFGYDFCIVKCFRTLVKLCLRAVNEAIIEWSYFMTPEIEITQRLNWLKYCSFQFIQFSFYLSFDWKMPFDFHFFLLENATIYCAPGIIARLQEV